MTLQSVITILTQKIFSSWVIANEEHSSTVLSIQ